MNEREKKLERLKYKLEVAVAAIEIFRLTKGNEEYRAELDPITDELDKLITKMNKVGAA